MKKLFASFVVLFIACAAMAQQLNRYVPADSIFAGTTDGLALLQSKIYNSFIFSATQKTMEDLLKEQGKTLAQAKKECGVAVFFGRIKSIAPQVQVVGGAVVRGTQKDSFAAYQNLTLEKATAQLKSSGVTPEMLQQIGVKLETITIEGKKALLASCVEPAFQIAMVAVSGNQLQVRFAFGTPVERKFFRPLKQYSAMTKELRFDSLFSLAVNVPSILKMANDPQAQQDPVAKSLKNVSFFIKENQDNLLCQIKVDTVSPESANMNKAQINAVVEQMKVNPQSKTFAEMIKLSSQGNTVIVKAEMPTDFLLAMFAQAVAARQQPQMAPAAPAGK